MKRNSGVKGKLSQLEYEASGRSKRVANVQKSLNELNVLLKKMEKKKRNK